MDKAGSKTCYIVLFALVCGILSFFIVLKDNLGIAFAWFVIGLGLGPVGVVLASLAGKKKRDQWDDLEDEILDQK